MLTQRVVVTGIGGVCGLGTSWAQIHAGLRARRNDTRCGELDYIAGAGRDLQPRYVMNNNFAFGGVNTSMIFKRWQ